MRKGVARRSGRSSFFQKFDRENSTSIREEVVNLPLNEYLPVAGKCAIMDTFHDTRR